MYNVYSYSKSVSNLVFSIENLSFFFIQPGSSSPYQDYSHPVESQATGCLFWSPLASGPIFPIRSTSF